MVGRDVLVGVDDGGEAPGEKGDLLEQGGRDGGAGEPGHVFEAGRGPVGDDEEGEEGGADGVEPPEGQLVADEGEEEGEGVEDDVGFAVCGIPQVEGCLLVRGFSLGFGGFRGFRKGWVIYVGGFMYLVPMLGLALS